MTGLRASQARRPDRRVGRSGLVAMVIAGVAFVVSAAGILLQLLAPPIAYQRAGIPSVPGVGAAARLVVSEVNVALVLLVATLICTRQPGNRIGWLLLAMGCASAATVLSPGLVLLAFGSNAQVPPPVDLVAWTFDLSGGISFGLMVVIMFLLPTGHAISIVWARWFSLVLIAWCASVVLVLLAPGPLSNATSIQNPLAVRGIDAMSTAQRVAAYTIPAAIALVIAALSIVVRYRRGSTVERLQLRWIVAAVALVALVAPVAVIGGRIDDRGFLLINAATAGIPIAIGIAVLRYRLYDIDRIISRTIGWAIVSGLLVVAFVGLVVGLQAALAPLTAGNTLAVAVSTLVAAALFGPLRSRVQRTVDRRFDRARYDGERLVADFGERLRDEVDLATIERDLLGTVDAAVVPATAGLWWRTRPEGAT